jgi:hypothetical protein
MNAEVVALKPAAKAAFSLARAARHHQRSRLASADARRRYGSCLPGGRRPAGALAGLGFSQDPFDTWFRDLIRDVHGIDLAQGFPPPEQMVDYRRGQS